jgi:hypothetical protein
MRSKTGETIAQLINRAVAKCYGPRCHWFSDCGLGLLYGQVVKDTNCLTYLVRVDLHKSI